MAKRPVAFECPPGAVDDVLGTCRNFNPSYDEGRVQSTLSRPADKEEMYRNALRAALSSIGLTEGTYSNSTKLGREVEDEEELGGILKVAGVRDLKGMDLSLLLSRGTVGDLLELLRNNLDVEALSVKEQKQAQVEAQKAAKTAYAKKVAECKKLVGDEESFREAGCKRRAHILLPAGRWSFRNLGKSAPIEVERGSKKKKNLHLESRDEKEIASHTKRLEKDGPPLDARTQGLRTRRVAQPYSETFEALSSAIEKGLTSYARGSNLKTPKEVKIPSSPEPLIRAGVPKQAADMLVQEARGRFISFRGSESKLSERLATLFGGIFFEFPEDADYKQDRNPRLNVTVPCRTCLGEGTGMRWRKGVEIKIVCPTCSGQGRVPLDRRKLRIRSVLVDRLLSVGGAANLKTIFLRKLDILQPDGSAVSLPLTSDYWPWETDDLATAKVQPGAQLRIQLETRLQTLGPDGKPLNNTEVIVLQHSELLDRGVLRRATDYSSLSKFTVPELSKVVARKILSPRKKKKDRIREPFHPDIAKNNPLPTYTLTEASLQGPALLLRPPLPGEDTVANGLGGEAVEHVGPMGPGMYKPYSPGKYIFWGTKKGADPKVVSEERLGTWLTISAKGALIASRSKGSGATAQANPRLPRYAQPNPSTSISAGSKKMANDYFPGSIWDFYQDGEFAAGQPQPVNRRNPSERKVRKAPSAAMLSWRKEFARMASSVEARAISSAHAKAAWEQIYPTAQRKPKHHADIVAHVNGIGAALNNPRAGFKDYPRETLYSEVQGQYGFDPRFGDVPANRRNPSERKVRKAPSAAMLSWRKEFARMASSVEARAISSAHAKAAWEQIYPTAQRKPKHHADIVAHVNGIAAALNNPRGKRSKVTAARAGGGVQYARFPSECHVCGEAFVTQRQAAVQSGLASQIVDSGVRGPRGGVKMVHAHCAK